MYKRRRFSSLFSKSALRLIGIIALFIAFAVSMSWIGDFASTKAPEVYTARHYDAPKQALTFQSEETRALDVALTFDKQSQSSKATSEQKDVVFTKVRTSEEEQKGRTYNFFGISFILLLIGGVVVALMYYQQESGKKSTFQIESVKK